MPLPSPLRHEQMLVLADIHCGDLANSDRLRNHKAPIMERDLRDYASLVGEALHSEQLSPTLLLVPGDLTSRGSPSEFRLTHTFVGLLAEQLKIEPACILITYGNHDMDWSVCGLAAEVGPTRDGYRHLASQMGDLFAPGAVPTMAGPVRGSGLYRFGDLEIIVLNSGYACYAISDKTTEYPHGKIGLEQLRWLEHLPAAAQDVTRVAVLHHHLINIPYLEPTADISTLEEGADVRREFGRLSVDLVIHGHRHHPYVTTTKETEWLKPIATLCAGSFGVEPYHRNRGRIPNTFHVVELKEQTPDGNRSGRVHTFRQDGDERWNLIPWDERNVAVDPQQWFGALGGGTVVEAAVNAILAPLAESVREKAPRHYEELPLHANLPLALRCLRAKTLNDLFTKSAARHHCRITGVYPNACNLGTKP